MPRLIIVAHGIQMRDRHWGAAVTAFLTAKCDQVGKPTPTGSTSWSYPKGAGSKATHQIRVVYEQGEFAAALDTPDALVVYEGHARLGQGPAFGPAGVGSTPDVRQFPVNPWGINFKMGYDATTTVALEDIVFHSTTPTEFDLTAVDPKAFLPHALATAAERVSAQAKEVKRQKLKETAACSVRGHWRAFDVCEPALAAEVTARAEVPLKGRHYFGATRTTHDYLTPVSVGSADLDALALKCTLFLMAACSSQVHYFEPLDRRRTAAKSRCKFILSSRVVTAELAKVFLEQVLLKKIDPTTKRGLAQLTRRLNAEQGSGNLRVY